MHKEKNCRNSLVLTKPQLCYNFPVNYHINLANCDRGFILVYINPRGALLDCLCFELWIRFDFSWLESTLKRGRAGTIVLVKHNVTTVLLPGPLGLRM